MHPVIKPSPSYLLSPVSNHLKQDICRPTNYYCGQEAVNRDTICSGTVGIGGRQGCSFPGPNPFEEVCDLSSNASGDHFGSRIEPVLCAVEGTCQVTGTAVSVFLRDDRAPHRRRRESNGEKLEWMHSGRALKARVKGLR